MTKVKEIHVEAFEIITESLDPIHVYWTDFNANAGMVTIVCYGRSWSAYFNAMGGDTIRQFFGSCDVDYLATKLGPSPKRDFHYLIRIVEAVKRSLAKEAICAR